MRQNRHEGKHRRAGKFRLAAVKYAFPHLLLLDFRVFLFFELLSFWFLKFRSFEFLVPQNKKEKTAEALTASTSLAIGL